MADAVCTCSSVLSIHLFAQLIERKNPFFYFFSPFSFVWGVKKPTTNHWSTTPLPSVSPAPGLLQPSTVPFPYSPISGPKAAFPAPLRVALPLAGGFSGGGGAARSDAATGRPACRRLSMIRLKPLRPTEILGRRVPLGSLVEAGGSRLPESGRVRTFGACKKFTGAGFWCRTQVGLRRARGPSTRFVLVCCSDPQRWQVAAGGLISPPPALPQNHDLHMMQ